MKTSLLLPGFILFSFFVQAQNADSPAVAREVDSLIQVSRALTDKQNFDKALQVIEFAEKITIEKLGKETVSYGNLCHNHGRILHLKGNLPEAEKWYIEAKSIREKVQGREHPDYAATLNNLASLYRGMGDFEKSEAYHLESISIKEKVLGKEHPDYASGLYNLAVLYYTQGKTDKAKPLFEEALAIREKVLDKKHPDYAKSLISLASLYKGTGNYEQSETLYLEVLSIQEKVLGKEHPDYASTLNNLAGLYFEMGNYEQVESLLIEAKSIEEKAVGKQHPDYIRYLNNLAIFYSKTGNYKKSEPLCIEAKDIIEKKYGKEHPDYIWSLSNLGNLYRKMGKYEEAGSLLLEAKTLSEKTQIKIPMDYATIINNLAVLYYEMGNYEQSEAFYLEGKTISEKMLGKKHPYYAKCLGSLANLYYETGNYEQAELYFLETKSLEEKIPGTMHADYASTLSNLATLYYAMGNYEKSESLQLEAMSIREKTLGKEHPHYAISLLNLANLYATLENYEKAEPLYIEAKNIREKTLGKEHTEYTSSVNNLAILYYETGNYQKSELLFLEAKAIREKVLGKEHPDYAWSLMGLANLYHKMGDYRKSEPLYLEAKDIREKVLGKEHPDYAWSLNNLAVLYHKMGKNQEAAQLLIETARLDRSLITKALYYLSEQELYNYLQILSERSDIRSSITQITADKNTVQACYDDILFYKSILLNSVNQIRHFILYDSSAIEKFNVLKSCRRRLAREYTIPVAERKNVPELEEKANTLEKELTQTVVGLGQVFRQVTWQEVQSQLQPDEAAVEFIHFRYSLPDPAQSVVYAALVQRPGWDAPRWVALFEQKQLQTLLDRGDNRNAGYFNSLYAEKQLYEMAWKPLEIYLNGVKTIHFSPSGLLHRLNLGAIAIPSPEGQKAQTLADRYRLAMLGSTRQLVIPAATTATTATATVFGGIRYDMDSTAIRQANQSINGTRGAETLPFAYTDSTLRSGDWKYLPWTAVEAISVAEILKTNGIQTQTRQRYAASEEYFKSLGQPGGEPSPRILHVATHGYFFPDPQTVNDRRWTTGGREPVFKISDHPMIRSGLILAGANRAWTTGRGLDNADDGVLTAYEISQLDLSNTELVVLSACETGLGDIQGNEGVYGLQRAFKFAGVKYLIMSLWPVPDYATQELMTLFYTNWLEEKMSIPDAFRAAQQQMRERFPSPFDWAGFVLVE